MKEAVSKVRGPLRRLQSVGLAYMEFALDQPEHFRVMFSVEFDRQHPGRTAAAEESFHAMVGIVTECRRAGLVPRLDPLTAASIAWAHTHGIAELGVPRRPGFHTRSEVLKLAAAATRTLAFGFSNALGT